MSIFESFPVAAGHASHLAPHLERLRRACAAHGFTCPPDALAQIDPQLTQSGATGWARIYVTAGEGAPTDPADGGEIFLFIEPRERTPCDAYQLVLAEETCHPIFGGAKTGNYWGNLHQLRRAQARGAHEALLFNERAELVSACCANVFLVHNGIVRTPALECGARDGVIREIVMRQVRVEETFLFMRDVSSADEIFVTNSWIGVMPAGSIDGRTLPSHRVATSFESLNFSHASSIVAPSPALLSGSPAGDRGGISEDLQHGKDDRQSAPTE
ncbi:MAG TPA: aminotransferase class IV [Chthoniobacteraceae bacterium]|nr:aminotransferase class IV [Chthoniobacteraceae bacterium]